MVMGRLKSVPLRTEWMYAVAKKHGISVDTVLDFYSNLDYSARPLSMNKRERTESFFDLYFEGRNANGSVDG